jgi:hypothetical protein
MDLLKMIAELRAERAAIDEAVAVLERLGLAQGPRRGRPPNWMTVKNAAAAEAAGDKPARPKGTRKLSPEARAKMAEAQRRRWEAYRKAKGE